MNLLNKLIDAQMSCNLCGTPGVFTCDCWIRQSCPRCGKVKWYARGPEIDPVNARELHVECLDCDPEQSTGLIYRDRAGREVPLE